MPQRLGKSLFLFLFLLFLGRTAHAAEPEWFIRSFHTDDGLSYEVVRDVALSPDHTTVWMATWGGGVSALVESEWMTLNKSNGLPTDSVRAVYTEKSGALWIGTDNGIGYYDGTSISIFLTSNTPGLLDHKIFTLHRIGLNEIWFSTAGGYLVATQADLPAGENRTWRTITGPEVTQGNAIRSILEEPNGRIWIACSRTGIFTSEDRGSSWTLSVSAGDPDGAFHDMARMADGTIWAVGGREILRYNGSTWERLRSPAEMSTCIAVTPEGELILGTNEGLFVQRKGEWDLYPLDEEDPRQYIECVVPLPDGSVWVGTRQGVFRLSKPSWTKYTQTSEGVSLLYDSLGAVPDYPPLALDVTGNLVRFENGEWSPLLRLMEANHGGKVTLTPPQEGKIWILGKDLALQCNLSPPRIERRIPLPAGVIPRELYVESEGRVWLLTQTGVFDLEGDTWRQQPQDPTYKRSQTYCLVKDVHGGYWAGMEDRVEYWRDGKVVQVFPAEGDLFPGLPPLQSITRANDGRLFFSTSSTGVMIRQGEEWRHITSRDGLITNRIRSIHESTDGTLWVGNRDSWISCRRNGRWTSFRLSDGVPPASVLSLGEANDGSVWACLERTCLLRYQRDTSPPNTIIQAQDTELNPGEVGFFSYSGKDAWNKTLPVDLDTPGGSWPTKTYHQTEVGRLTPPIL